MSWRVGIPWGASIAGICGDGGPGLIQLTSRTDLIVQTGAMTVTAPAGRGVGDRLLLQVHSPTSSGQWSSGQSTPTGWAILQSGTGVSNNEAHIIHHRIADGTSADDAALNAPLGANPYLIRMSSWSNVDPANPFILPTPVVYNSDTTSFVAPAINHALRQNVTLRMYGGDNSPTRTPAATYPLCSDAMGGSFIVDGTDRDGEGNAGTSTLTLGNAEQGAALSIGLRPLLAGVPTVRSGTTFLTSLSAANATFPTDVASGDIAYCAVAVRYINNATALPAGWTSIGYIATAHPSGWNLYTRLFQKNAACDGTEDSTTVAVSGIPGYACGFIFTVRGAGTIGGLTTATDTTSFSFSGPTGTDAYGVLLMVDHYCEAAALAAHANDDLFLTHTAVTNLQFSGTFSHLSLRVMPYDATGPATLTVPTTDYAQGWAYIAWA